MRRVAGCRSLGPLVILALLGHVSYVSGEAPETSGVITEIKVGRGKAEMRRAGGERRAAGPLQALRAGDEISTTENAVVVVVLTRGRGAVRVDARTSPWVVPAASDLGKAGKAHALVESGLSYLSGSATELPDVLLSTRAGGPPRILSPRDGPTLGAPVVFEWTGSASSRYTVRVLTPAGMVFERQGVAGTRFVYPEDAAPLTAGVRYTLAVGVLNREFQVTTFEVVDEMRRATMREELAGLEGALGPAGTPATIAAIQAGALAAKGFLYDARLVVLAALSADPREPALHATLGTIYQKTGLHDYAAAAFGEANALLGRRNP